MADNDTPDIQGSETNKPGLSGQMFLYEQPELLAPEEHGALGFTPPPRPYEFVKGARAIPLTMVEFGSAQRHFPIVFSSLEKPVPVAITGLDEGVNLFVEDGIWDPMAYVPSYVRCWPFAFAAEKEGRMAVVVDRASPAVTENPTYPFFVDGKISEQTEQLMNFCAQVERERRRTMEFCEKLMELDLLTVQRTTHTPDGNGEPETLADYVCINAEKLNELPADTVYELHQAGFLSAMYLELYSIENWRHLMARKVRRNTGAVAA